MPNGPVPRQASFEMQVNCKHAHHARGSRPAGLSAAVRAPARPARRTLAVRAFLPPQPEQQPGQQPGQLQIIAAPRNPGPGGVVTTSGCVALAAEQPTYAVHITYVSSGRILEGCDAIFAHAGHSGWLDK